MTQQEAVKHAATILVFLIRFTCAVAASVILGYYTQPAFGCVLMLASVVVLQ